MIDTKLEHPEREGEPALAFRGLTKKYGGTVALRDVSLDIVAGSVHALVGANGAGKSTCMGVISGRVAPDAGAMTIFGSVARFGDIRASRDAGIAAIYQELTIIPTLSVQANIFLGQESSQRGLIRDKQMARSAERLCEQLGVHVPLQLQARYLSVADRQLVEILRALIADPKIILFDEPTAALAAHEKRMLFDVIKRLKTQGRTSVFVSHNLDDVLAVADVITVFRDGSAVATRAVSEWTKRDLVHAVVGRELAQATRPRLRSGASVGQPKPPLLSVRELSVPGVLNSISFDVDEGEIVGLAGPVGSGRSTLLRALAGDVPQARGELLICGEAGRWPRHVQQARRLGFALLPESRAEMGLFMSMSALENILMADMHRTARFGLVRRSHARREAVVAATRVGFDQRRLDSAARMLSGGNQQKVLLARCMYGRPRILLADEFARGVDVGAKSDVASVLRALAAEGMAVIAVSSELEDLEIADRALAIVNGEIIGELVGPSAVTTENMTNLTLYGKSPDG